MALRLLLICLFLGGCTVFVTPPQVQLRQVTAVGLDTAGVDLEVELLVHNPNRFDLTLLGYSYALQMLDTPLSSGGARQRLNFTADQDTVVRIPARVQHTDLLSVLKKQPDPDRIPYRLIAGLQVETPLGETSIPVDQRGQFAIPERYRPSNLIQRFKGLFEGR